MEQTTIREIKETMESIRTSFIPRAESNTLNPRDAAFLSEIVGDLKKGIAEEAGRNENVKEIYGCLAQMQGLLDDPEPTSARQIAGLEAAISRDMDEMEKIVHIANALQLDAHGIQPLLEQIRKKQEEVMQSFQAAVDIDFKLYGEMSGLTKNAMEAFHFEVNAERKVTTAWQAPEPSREHGTGTQMQEREQPPVQPEEKAAGGKPANDAAREYLKILPQGREQFKEATEFLKQSGGRYDPEKRAWFMPEGRISLQELKKHRIEPAEEKREYLRLPPMGKDQFKEALEFLKANGARYDARREKPAWYVFPGKEGDKIKDYLHRISGEKDSVLSKLNQKKGMAGRTEQRKNTMENRENLKHQEAER